MLEPDLLLKKNARLAGWLYVTLAVLAFFALMYGPAGIMVRDNAAATAANLLSHELKFRLSIAAHLASAVALLMLAVVLYRLFRDVHLQQARLLVIFMIVQIPIVFVLESFKLTALMTAQGRLFTTFPREQAQDLMMTFFRMYSNGLALLELFWGLWLLPFALLVLRSGFIPPIFGILLLLAGIGYAADSLTTIIIPKHHPFSQKVAFILSALGEVSTMLWLCIKGVRSHPSTRQPESRFQQ